MSTPQKSAAGRCARGMARGIPCSRIMTSSTSEVTVARAATAAATLAPWSKAMRAQRWLEAKQLATPMRIRTPARAGIEACGARTLGAELGIDGRPQPVGETVGLVGEADDR